MKVKTQLAGGMSAVSEMVGRKKIWPRRMRGLRKRRRRGGGGGRGGEEKEMNRKEKTR